MSTPPPPPPKFFFYTKFCFNIGNSMKREENTLPPPQTTPTFEIQNQNKGIEDIDSNCPYLLFGETTSHLTSKQNVTDRRTDRQGVSIFFLMLKIA